MDDDQLIKGRSEIPDGEGESLGHWKKFMVGEAPPMHLWCEQEEVMRDDGQAVQS